MNTEKYKNWNVHRDDDGIHWLEINKENSKTNVLSKEVLEELEQELDLIKQDLPKGVIFSSGKESGFIAGADINEFTKFESEQDALLAIQRGHKIMNAIEDLKCTTVALIHGHCLGGGLELALACDYRIAEDDPKTRLGLPEVLLGIHPGFGGSLRMIRAAGPMNGMTAMLTGKSYISKVAKKMGFIDYAVPKRHFINAARSIVMKPKKPAPNKLLNKIINYKFIRPLVAKIFEKNVAKKASRVHYPAPYALIDLWVHYYDNPKKMLEEEANSIAKLLVGKTAQNMVRVFKLKEQLKNSGSKIKYSPTHIHVIGGGIMGGDIAAWCALKGFNVTIQDQDHETLARVIQRAYKLYKRRLKNPRLVQHALDRLIPDFKGISLPQADIVIEAIFEDLDAKQNLYKEIEPRMKEGAILATNTSSIPIEKLSTVLKSPNRLVGLHFFNPVAMMPLVEIVKTAKTDEDVYNKAASFTKKIDRLPLIVNSTPGFLVNRILMPYLMEAVIMIDEGVPAQAIDKAALEFGMPMGPIELADTVGLDICLHVAEILSESMDISVPSILKDLVNQKKLGKKTGQGFYEFQKGKPVKQKQDKSTVIPANISERLILILVNEAISCLRDGVVESKDMVDAGIIFGTGFAPFRGGPIHYTESRGSDQLLKKIEQLQHTLGDRFKPDEGWSTVFS
ncbi:MAG: 3-hydroxyacyl-CoA dehydrogenase NAD-binding domain-containing protein [Gammaproteobacteria bacterium]